MSKIDELLKDPKFKSLMASNPDKARAFVAQMKQQDFGIIPNTENLLTNAIKSSGINFSVAGLPSAVNPNSRPEDALPMIAQFGTDAVLKASPQGRIASLIPGVPWAATTLSTTGAEGVRQGAKALRGEGFDSGKVGETAAITAGTEALGRGAESFLFKTQIGKQVIKEAQKNLGGALKKLFTAARTNPAIQVAKADLLGFLQHTYENIPFKVGPQASGLKRVIGIVEREFPDMIGPREISQTENILGDISNFDPKRAGTLPNKVANIEVKRGRDYASGQLEHMAQEAGVPEVKTASKEVHMAKKKYQPDRKMGMAEIIGKRIAGPGALGALVGTATHNPMLGAGAAVGDIILQHEPTANFLYNLIMRSGLSRTGRVGVSEGLRRNS